METDRGTFKFASALRGMARMNYRSIDFRGDVMAGITVGIIALPLAMALAIASGVAPQYGLYTAIVAGAIAALTGGSRVNVSGPTAAFVVILLPITEKYGLGGLLIATVMAGMMLVAMGLARMGRLLEYIPYPVTTGFTAGIGTVIAFLQIKDLLGLEMQGSGGVHFFDKLGAMLSALPTTHLNDFLIGALTFAVLLLWGRLKTAVPPHLIALIVGSLIAFFGHRWFAGFDVSTIGSRFTYVLDGVEGHGIPQVPPTPLLPWTLPDAHGQPVGLSFALIRELIGPAFAIAMLGAIESLLCAVVADGLAGTRHNPNAELVGQGIGNIIAPFFGGITATAAIARTATSVRSGAKSPVAAVVHSLVVLCAILLLAPLLAHVPMASLAALLLLTAWNMSDAKHFAHILKVAPRSDVIVLLVCFTLTVVFDMVIAVTVGVLLAAALFIRRMSEITGSVLVDQSAHEQAIGMPSHIAVYDINGPLFFGAAEKAIGALQMVDRKVKVVILDMGDVSHIDMTAIVALESLLHRLQKGGVAAVINNLDPRLTLQLTKAGVHEVDGKLAFSMNMEEAKNMALKSWPVT